MAKEALEFETARQSELLAVSSHQMSLSAHRLNTLAGLFFPMVTLAGIFGMNFKHGLEEKDWPIPFIGTVVLGLVLGIGVTGILAARTRRAVK